MAQESSGFRDLLNRKAAAAYVGMSETSFRRYMKIKSMPKPKHYKIGNRTRFKPEQLDEWMETFLKT